MAWDWTSARWNEPALAKTAKNRVPGMTSISPDPARLGTPPVVAGLRLDGDIPVIIDPGENERLCRTMGVAPSPAGEAHPCYYYIATQVGMGMSVAELCARCDFDVRDGPMMATSSVRFLAPLMTATPYVVRGQVIGLVRKPSRSLGVMDLLDYALDLHTLEGELVIQVVNQWVLPRKRIG